MERSVVQPAILQEPSSMSARGSKLNAEMFVHPGEELNGKRLTRIIGVTNV